MKRPIISNDVYKDIFHVLGLVPPDVLDRVKIVMAARKYVKVRVGVPGHGVKEYESYVRSDHVYREILDMFGVKPSNNAEKITIILSDQEIVMVKSVEFTRHLTMSDKAHVGLFLALGQAPPKGLVRADILLTSQKPVRLNLLQECYINGDDAGDIAINLSPGDK